MKYLNHQKRSCGQVDVIPRVLRDFGRDVTVSAHCVGGKIVVRLCEQRGGPARYVWSRRFVEVTAAALVVAGLFAGSMGSSRASAASRSKTSGIVNVLYAGSLLDLMQQQIGPAFHKPTPFSANRY